MKRRLTLLAAVLICAGEMLQAEDWTTTFGKVFRDVKVVKVEADAVTIIYADGGALIPLARLPKELQKRFNYDPVKAQAAADARAKGDDASAKALQDEKDKTKNLEQGKQAEQKAEQRAAAARLRADASSYHGVNLHLPSDHDQKQKQYDTEFRRKS